MHGEKKTLVFSAEGVFTILEIVPVVPIRSTNNFGTVYYKVLGLLHREDGPAVEYTNGRQAWYFRGNMHRENGPAYIDVGINYSAWWVHGKRHREDGPAVEWSTSRINSWYIQDRQMTEEEHDAWREENNSI